MQDDRLTKRQATPVSAAGDVCLLGTAVGLFYDGARFAISFVYKAQGFFLSAAGYVCLLVWMAARPDC